MTDNEQRMHWLTSERAMEYSKRPLIMGILNVTPDSFSDGGDYELIDQALERTGEMIKEGADIIDVGGESTRPGGFQVSFHEEVRRTAPVIEQIKKRFDIPVSIDTTKSEVAKAAIDVGAEIINDVSGLSFDPKIAKVAAGAKTGIILMHLVGSFKTMHKKDSSSDIVSDVSAVFEDRIQMAQEAGVKPDCICLDVGIGFSKTVEQNLELVARGREVKNRFPEYPILIGVSRKSFIGKILSDLPVDERLNGTIAANVIAVMNGANIIRVHDVKANFEATRMANEMMNLM